MVRYFPVRLCLAPVVVSGFLLFATASSADGPGGVVATLQYERGNFSEAFIDTVAKYGARTSSPYVEGKSIDEYAFDICGNENADNIVLFRRALEGDGIRVLEDGSVALEEGATELKLPGCLPDAVKELTPRIARPNTTFYDYFTTDDAGAVLFGSDRLFQVSPRDVLASAASGNSGAPIFSGAGDELQIKGLFSAKTAQWSSAAKSPDEVSFDAFLTANDLVQAGSDPGVVLAAVSDSLSLAAGDELGTQMTQAVAGALNRYSLSGSAISSDQWANIGKVTPYTSSTTFTDQIQWLDPNPQERKGEALGVGHIALIPSFKSQSVDIVFDPALLPEGAGDPVSFVQQALNEAGGGDDVPAEVMLLETQGMDDVENSRCDDAAYGGWGTTAFAEAFANGIIRSRLLGVRAGAGANRTQIVVVDSGFVQARDMGAFGSGVLNESGAMLDRQNASNLLGERQFHGTAVAGVVIGGPDLWGLTEALGLQIGFVPRRIYNEFMVDGTVVPMVDWNRMYQAIDSDGDIYNLSFATTNKRSMGEFEDFLGPRSQKLFVVAAGNNNMNYDNHGVDLSVTDLFPQLFSDERAAPNLITVAAYDGKGMAWFSNFSDDIVSIAAPGCAIATWVPDAAGNEYVETDFAGTSFAAPIVSYVAAIVKSLMPVDHQTPIWVRSRILASSDLVPGLEGVADGRLLNPIKAVSVYEDVVETSDGIIRKGQAGLLNVRELCDAPGLAADAVFLKFARLPESRGGKDSVVYYLRNRELQSMDCQHHPNRRFALSTTDGTISIKVGDIRDIVLRIRENGTQ